MIEFGVGSVIFILFVLRLLVAYETPQIELSCRSTSNFVYMRTQTYVAITLHVKRTLPPTTIVISWKNRRQLGTTVYYGNGRIGQHGTGFATCVASSSAISQF